MAKAPGESRIPIGGSIPILKSTKGAVRRTLQNGLSAGSRFLPSKNKLPIIKPISRLMDNKKQAEGNDDPNENAKITTDATFDKLPELECSVNTTIVKDTVVFATCDKIDPEKTYDLLADKNFDRLDDADKVKEAKERSNNDTNDQANKLKRSDNADEKIIEFRKKLEDMKTKSKMMVASHLFSKDNRVDGECDSGPYSLLVGLDSKIIKHNETAILESETKLPDLCVNKESLIEDETMPEFSSYMTNVTMDSIPLEAPEARKSLIESKKLDVEMRFSSPLTGTFIPDLPMSTPSIIHNDITGPMSLIECESMPSLMLNVSEVVCADTIDENLPTEDVKRGKNATNAEFKIDAVSKKMLCRPSDCEEKQFVLQPLTRKQNSRPPTTVFENDTDSTLKLSNSSDVAKSCSVSPSNLLSPVASDNSVPDISKQNSFDESLGILTPEQMDSLSFLDNVLSPSMDDFLQLQDDKTAEKTESSTPQTPTEIMKSLTPDGIESLTKSKCSPVLDPLEHDDVKIEPKPLEAVAVLNEEIETYEMFVQRPFKASTEENLSNGNELCLSVAPNHTVDDELLPSVHSSILDALSSIIDTTRFDNVQHSVRMDQTPSPEELPLDPVDIKSDLSAMSTDPKTDQSKSVTSLDGYQGDGEMSRPVSRGADQSPTIGHRAVNNMQNWQNIPISRRPDPMTDSDFFTESDADGHDEQIHRGDRRAQVIDGALYGGGKNSNPPVLVSRGGNNDDSCMESSGVFTDMETHRCSPLLLDVIDDLSPEGSTPSTKSDLSQNNNSELYHPDEIHSSLDDTLVAINSSASTRFTEGCSDEQSNSICEEKIERKQSFVSSSGSNDKMNKEDKNMALKKHKMPRRDVASKVKTMMGSSSVKSLTENGERPKKEGRWDAVMNKIFVNKSESKLKSHLKDVKPKVNTSPDKTAYCEDNSLSSNGNKPKSNSSTTKLKSRRVKSSRMPKMVSSSRSTPHSSQSDISVSCVAPKSATGKHTITHTRAAKKRDGVAGPGRTLSSQPSAPASTPTHAPPGAPSPPVAAIGAYAPGRNRTPPSANGRLSVQVKKPGAISPLNASSSPVANNVLKNAPPPRKPISRRSATQLSSRNASSKDENRAPSPANVLKASVKVGATPPVVPVSIVSQQPPTRDVEALAVLVQYLVFHLDALNAPRWKAQATEAKAQLAEAANRLQRALAAQKIDQNTLAQNLNRINQLEKELQSKDAEYNASLLSITATAEKKYRATLAESCTLSAEIKNLKATLQELKRDVADSRVRVIQAEDANRRHVAERTTILNELKIAKSEVERLRVIKEETEKALENQLKENEIIRSQQRLHVMRQDSEVQTNIANSMKDVQKKESQMFAEVDSLKSVLEMKMEQLSELRKKVEEYQNAADQLPLALQKIATLKKTVEDLQTQLTNKSQDEINLKQQCRLLEESFTRETAAKNRLSQHNEELKYKLRQNIEVVNCLVNQNVRSENSVPNQRRVGFPVPSMTDHFSLNHTFHGDSFVRGQSRATVSFNEKYLNSINLQDRRGEWRPNFRRMRSENDKSITPEMDRSLDCLQYDNSSPPSSPRIKGVVEKNDSVSYVLEIEETPEEMASRLVRRAGSFRVAVSPPSRENIKRQRSRQKASLSAPPHSLSQSASASCIEPISIRNTSAHCKLFRSNSIEHNTCTQLRPKYSSTPNKAQDHRSLNISSPHDDKIFDTGLCLESNQCKQIKSDAKSNIENHENASEDVNGELEILQECELMPKESAGEALISGANSEDDSSLDERCHSSSDSESGSECDKYVNINGGGERLADPLLQKIAETMDQNLSATPMDVSWSEDVVIGVTESDV